MAADKLTETYQFRIPAITKSYIEKLPPEWKKKLNQELINTAARVLLDEELERTPEKYLKKFTEE